MSFLCSVFNYTLIEMVYKSLHSVFTNILYNDTQSFSLGVLHETVFVNNMHSVGRKLLSRERELKCKQKEAGLSKPWVILCIVFWTEPVTWTSFTSTLQLKKQHTKKKCKMWLFRNPRIHHFKLLMVYVPLLPFYL